MSLWNIQRKIEADQFTIVLYEQHISFQLAQHINHVYVTGKR